jgi:hypothetical protein
MNSHLNENEIAQYAEYLNGDNVEPDEEVRLHVESCMECKQEILEVSEIILFHC